MNTSTSSTGDGSKATEGRLARAIEKQTAKVPSDVFVWLAGGAMVGSLALQATSPKRMGLFGIPSRHGQIANFVGQWVPTLLIFGIYNKIVKVLGSDYTDR